MIYAHYKYDKKSAEDFICSHIKDLPHTEGTNVTVEIVPENIGTPIPNAPLYSFSYPCPVRILEEIMNPNGLIPAIKELRAITGWGLKESKDYVEYIARIVRRLHN